MKAVGGGWWRDTVQAGTAATVSSLHQLPVSQPFWGRLMRGPTATIRDCSAASRAPTTPASTVVSPPANRLCRLSYWRFKMELLLGKDTREGEPVYLRFNGSRALLIC